jgi:hypothetical protein
MPSYFFIAEFEKDFKKLEKRFRTLKDDFENMKRSLLEVHYLKNTPSPANALVDIKGCCGEKYKSQKVRKFACKSLKNLGNRSGIRIIFVIEFSENKDFKITFIEIYYKGDKENEDRARLLNFINSKRLI